MRDGSIMNYSFAFPAGAARSGYPALRGISATCAAGDIVAFAVQHLHDIFVAERMQFVLVLDDLLHADFHDAVRDVVALEHRNFVVKEPTQFVNAPIALQIFVIHDTTDRRDVHANALRNMLVNNRL